MWDSDWEEDVEEYNYRHQRRLSDPSSNLNNFSRNGWRTKNPTDSYSSSNKARSENEGLDCLANEVSEIEAGDLRDGMYMKYPSCMQTNINVRFLMKNQNSITINFSYSL